MQQRPWIAQMQLLQQRPWTMAKRLLQQRPWMRKRLTDASGQAMAKMAALADAKTAKLMPPRRWLLLMRKRLRMPPRRWLLLMRKRLRMPPRRWLLLMRKRQLMPPRWFRMSLTSSRERMQPSSRPMRPRRPATWPRGGSHGHREKQILPRLLRIPDANAVRLPARFVGWCVDCNAGRYTMSAAPEEIVGWRGRTLETTKIQPSSTPISKMRTATDDW